jgi:hypothetical protein
MAIAVPFAMMQKPVAYKPQDRLQGDVNDIAQRLGLFIRKNNLEKMICILASDSRTTTPLCLHELLQNRYSII